MEIENDDRGGYKRIHQRLGPTSRQPDRGGKVCFQWRAGHCTRHPCPFLHSEQDPSNSKRSLGWRNPNTGGSGSGPNNGGHQSKWGKGRHGENSNSNSNAGRLNGGVGTSGGDRPCKFFVSGNCSFGDRCRYPHSWSFGEGFSLITPLKGHEKVVTAIALPSGSDKLYSGSKDKTVKVWDCQTGQCTVSIPMGGEIGCMICEDPWLFVGIPDSIKVWNTQTGAEMNLPGPTGQVYALAAANDMLFAGTQDGKILIWRFNAATNCFEPATFLVGHRLAVISLVVGGPKLYSCSMDNTIKAWDLTTLQCVQTLSDHTNVVMSLLCWEQFLLSCSLDSTVKVWVHNSKEQLEVTYTHTEEHGVISLCGMHDVQGKPVLLCSLNDNTVRLYDLPSFNERGKIFAKQEVRAMQTGPNGLFFTGDGTGELKVWTWSTN
ncbi:zinc finger WD40 repeat protein 1 [Rhynchospora pubera]|uniref:Zinc finger WD40 repeat protein 1 n=1 Tax=Rhynchospora pubera TaxID=906938 RepID=A0AAV8BW53_9POAL|nr:zinc finger WD40 repeat protein 1 [Rhynchospora pubera]